ncbi:Pol protein [Phytophthora palmivora]|uniref:Pol protein n=1 Tax=Phytophthora palmivora TaxID=4796 RepID=A0A2P4YUU4_9STRA|nr:Pol protein [Phytophthora palmivora]
MVDIFGGGALRSLAVPTLAEQVERIEAFGTYEQGLIAHVQGLQAPVNPYERKEGENLYFWVRKIKLAVGAALTTTGVALALSNLEGHLKASAYTQSDDRMAFQSGLSSFALPCLQRRKHKLYECIQDASLLGNPLPEHIKVTVLMAGLKLLRLHANTKEEAIRIDLQEEYNHKQARTHMTVGKTTARQQVLCTHLRSPVPDLPRVGVAERSEATVKCRYVHTLVWGHQHQDAFNSIKKGLQYAPVLALPDEAKSFSTMCDASNYSIFCVMLQRTFIIPFQARRRKTDLPFFAEYNFRVDYKPGKLNVLADALSRRPDYELAHVSRVTTDLYDRIRLAYQEDENYTSLVRFLSNGKDAKVDRLSPRQRAQLHRYELADGLLHYRVDPGDPPRVVVPNDEDLKYDILLEAHDSPTCDFLCQRIAGSRWTSTSSSAFRSMTGETPVFWCLPVLYEGDLEHLFQLLGTKLTMSTAYYQKNNSQTGCVNRVLEDTLRGICAEAPRS